MKLVRRKYDESYSENILYREAPNSQRNKKRLREIMKHKQAGALLEIGCSKGRFLRMALEHFDAEGIDVSQYVVDAIRASLGCKVKALNVETAALPPERYDVIAAFNVLEHLKDPASVSAKVYASLREDGLLIGSVPNNSGPVGTVATSLGNLMDRTHHSTYPPPHWRRLFQKAGFAGITFFGEMNLGKNACRYVKNGLWRYVSPNLMFLCTK